MPTGILTHRRTLLTLTPPSGPRLFDNFNRADSTTSLGVATSGQTWTALSGTWGITANKGYHSDATAQSVAILPSTTGDGDLTCRVTAGEFIHRADCGLVFRAADNNNYMMVAVTEDGTTNAFRMFKKVGGTYTQIGSSFAVGVTTAQTYTLRIVYAGTSLTVYIDGTNWFSTTATTGLETNTGVGIRVNFGTSSDSNGSRFDDFTLI